MTTATTTATTGGPAATARTEQTAPSVVDAVGTGVVELVRLLNHLDRPDLVERVTAAGARLKRPATIIAVVGEFKQGKSSLVNGLLGQPVCPVDDDLATSAITLVKYGNQPSVVVRRNDGRESQAERIPISDLDQWVSERGNPGNEKHVERVEITTPAAILKQGLVIVDTPGMGGLGAGHAAATLGFLPFADGLILASDSSAELSAPEIDFLRRAVELCPTVMFAQTKTDLYPEWERIKTLNEGHLARAGLQVPMLAVSSTLRTIALQRKDRAVNEASRFPTLIGGLDAQVIKPAKETAATRSANDVQAVAQLVRSGLERELELQGDPAALADSIAEMNRAKERLEHLRGPGARWSVFVNDRISDLTTNITHELRSGMRSITRDLDEQIEGLNRGDQWDEMSRDLQTRAADEVARAFVAVEDGRRNIRAAALELLEEEDLELASAAGAGRIGTFDLGALWREKSIEGTGETGAKANFKTALTGARGAQGGVMMFGMMGNFLPGAAAAFMATNPVLLGAGALFGGFQLMEDRKRKVGMRRQNARQQMRQFIDDVQFQVTNEITTLVRSAHRELRDDLTARLAELQRTYTAAAQRAQSDAKQTQEQQTARRAELDQQLAAIRQIIERVQRSQAAHAATGSGQEK